MMDNINILELTNSIKKEGYEGEYVDAKLCQDIILLLISKSAYANNITIKGGVVMRSITNNTRRATLDIDLKTADYGYYAKEYLKRIGLSKIEINTLIEN